MKEYAIAALTGLMANPNVVNLKSQIETDVLAHVAWQLAEEMRKEGERYAVR